MKRSRSLVLLFTLFLAAGAVACSETDAGVTTKVKAKFAADDTVKAYQINVDTDRKIVTLKGKAGSMTVHHVRTLHGSAPNHSHRARLMLFYECHAADAWPLLGSGAYIHRLGQQAIWDDLNERLICGSPTLEPRVEPVPVRLPLPPPADASSIFKTQRSGGARSVFA